MFREENAFETSNPIRIFGADSWTEHTLAVHDTLVWNPVPSTNDATFTFEEFQREPETIRQWLSPSLHFLDGAQCSLPLAGWTTKILSQKARSNYCQIISRGIAPVLGWQVTPASEQARAS
jgi:hypothetical protein